MRTISLLLGSALILLAAPPASAFILTFSASSSDETDAAALDAVLDIQVSGTTLTLTLTNQSSYNLGQLYFNAGPSAAELELELTSATHSDGNSDVTSSWALVLAGPPGNPTQAGGFGTFDFLLDGPVGAGDPALIGPGESIDFALAIGGTGPFTASDFVELTSGPFPSFAAVKFMNGPDDDSAFGNAVPEPGTAALLVSGLAALAVQRRRRAAFAVQRVRS